jgi:hypothetical protein
MNGGFGSMGDKVFMAYFRELSEHVPGDKGKSCLIIACLPTRDWRIY